jgi:hypothetical protein
MTCYRDSFTFTNALRCCRRNLMYTLALSLRLSPIVSIVSGNFSDKICVVWRETHDGWNRYSYLSFLRDIKVSFALLNRTWFFYSHNTVEHINTNPTIMNSAPFWRTVRVMSRLKAQEWTAPSAASQDWESLVARHSSHLYDTLSGDATWTVRRNGTQFMGVVFLMICSTTSVGVEKSSSILKGEADLDIS